jgi:succinyl-CoA synthetase alpha subunit
MFKVGFTHNPVWRWGSPIYGYASKATKEKYSNMSVIYAAPEPYSPAMLEAALIDKYKRLLVQLMIYIVVVFFRVL